MALVTRKFGTLADLNAFYGGRIRGSVPLTRTPGSLFLHGLTLITSTPAASVTFAATPAAAQVPLTLQEVKEQIEDQSAAALTVNFVAGHLELRATTPGALVIDKDGTANPLLGIDTSADSSAAVVSEPGGSAPTFVALGSDSGSNSYLLTTDDA
jgi:hypothetical protein